MFVNLIQFPPLKPGKDAEFKEWFAWSNSVYSKFKGFKSRKLLRSEGKGNYATITEHESEETFLAMHKSEERQKVWDKVEPLLEGMPTRAFYEVITSI